MALGEQSRLVAPSGWNSAQAGLRSLVAQPPAAETLARGFGAEGPGMN